MTNEWQKFKEKVKNGIVEISRVSFEDADEQVFNKRLNICSSCDKFSKLTHQCKECGCFMNLKAKLLHSKCPLDKWEE